MAPINIDHYGPKKEERAADTDEEPTRKAVYEKLGIPPSSWNPDMGNLKDTVAYRLKVTTFDV
ncbi:hypothetical protein PENANT_c012G01982 [Penicillium antarcticum]|uniref:Uncharacterized protein n=1 Tax=Penicillium antarcticum TaxID=416450 RepID=A0A1V6Q638_9EURO|nr:hypothetical protein PENANT_c012G01982 [Penicillium antarcticum]